MSTDVDILKNVVANLEAGETVEAVLAALAADRIETVEAAPVVPVVPAITEPQRKALERIVEVYGQVVPDSRRKFSEEELESLAEERETIATVLKFLTARKDDSIREAISTHFDVKAEQEKVKAEKDNRGHYAIKQDEPLANIGKKFERQVTDPKPTVSSEKLLALVEEGKLTRAQYNALTSVPKVKRNFDSTKAAKAISKDPALLYLLAEATEQRPKQTSIWLKDL